MKHVRYVTKNVCSREINFDIDDNGNITNLVFTGGCNGNLKAIGKLCEGKNAKDICMLLKGNDCHGRGTSCADQLSKAIEENL